MPKLKCPACGSLDTVKIVYGMPTYEAFQAAERGEFVLGGCCVSEEDPDRACKACGRKFGRDSSYLKVNKDIISFYFFIGGYFGESHHVYIDGTMQDKLLKYARTPGGLLIDLKEPIPEGYYERDDFFVKEVLWSDQQWRIFIDEVGDCNVEYWNDNYNDDTALDGAPWSLEIMLPERQDIIKSGSNAYPPAWKRFLKVLRKFTEEQIG